MSRSVPLVEVWRGEVLECVHRGHAVIAHADGSVIEAWGDPDQMILPRSSSKMLQALALVESGAADAAGLGTEHLALACASHQGAAIHTTRVQAWLKDLGLGDADLRCGSQWPGDETDLHGMIRAHEQPCQWHNNCSGKHSGFLTLNRHLRGGAEYIDPDHPVQRAVMAAFGEVTGTGDMGHAIDGCSAPNPATTVMGLAVAMARMSAPDTLSGSRGEAARRLVDAMMAHPELVAGERRACTELMRAMRGTVAVKTGAEGVFVAILPQQRVGIALKIEDGATRASECAMAALLVRRGVLDRADPMAQKRLAAPVINRRGIWTGVVRAVDGLA